MGLFGELLALPVKIVNVPLKVVDHIMQPPHINDEPDAILSAPLQFVAEELEKVDD